MISQPMCSEETVDLRLHAPSRTPPDDVVRGWSEFKSPLAHTDR
jgi:hypothetical protein